MPIGRWDKDGEGIFALLEVIWPGLGHGVGHAAELGGVWQEVSTPFISTAWGRPVAHVGLIALPLVLSGRPVTVGTVHAVCTHPDYRRSGHYRRAMEELLAHAAGRFETLILTTEHPEYFTPFGFRELQEHGFFVTGRRGGGVAPESTAFRRLDFKAPGDVQLLGRLLAEREPVSLVAGVRSERVVFCFNEGRKPLHYIEPLDALVCLETHGEELRLLDVVSPKIPSLDELLAAIPGTFDRVTIAFTPDRLGEICDASTCSGTGCTKIHSRPWLFDHDGPAHLMVRGPFAPEGTPFSLPRSART
jgi:GNAT superfamily N-acetyltransferase